MSAAEVDQNYVLLVLGECDDTSVATVSNLMSLYYCYDFICLLNVFKMCVNNMTTWIINLNCIRFGSSVSILLNWILFKCGHFRPTTTGKSMNFDLCLAERMSDWTQWILSTKHHTHIYLTETEQMRMKKWQCKWLAWKFYKQNKNERIYSMTAQNRLEIIMMIDGKFNSFIVRYSSNETVDCWIREFVSLSFKIKLRFVFVNK